MILELHRQGVSVSAIARRVALDRKTVRRYIAKAWSRRPAEHGHPALPR
jgi:transposase